MIINKNNFAVNKRQLSSKLRNGPQTKANAMNRLVYGQLSGIVQATFFGMYKLYVFHSESFY